MPDLNAEEQAIFEDLVERYRISLGWATDYVKSISKKLYAVRCLDDNRREEENVKKFHY